MTVSLRIGVDEKAKAGYIDAKGHVVIPPTFDAHGDYGYDDFFNGIALVEIGRQYWYINAKGERLFREHDSGPFSEGFADFRQGDRFGYLNTHGQVAVPAMFEAVDRFSEGVAAVQIGRKYGYIGPQGRIVIKPSFGLAFSFKNGFARVIKESGCLYIGYGPCDAFNPMVLPFTGLQYRMPTGKETRCRYSFIDRAGRELSANTYREAKDFSEQTAPVGDGRAWGFIDTNGTMVIPLAYQNAESFSEGLAAVQIDGKWGYVNHAGKLVIAPTFLAAFPFSEGLAVAMINGWQYEFIDRTGKRAIPASFTGASSFVMGLAHVRSGVNYDAATWAYIDHQGQFVFRYDERGPLAHR
ncbi:MAG TPA: WG repeat-containing protein [Bryobacteraceae bacterium]